MAIPVSGMSDFCEALLGWRGPVIDPDARELAWHPQGVPLHVAAFAARYGAVVAHLRRIFLICPFSSWLVRFGEGVTPFSLTHSFCCTCTWEYIGVLFSACDYRH